MESVELDIMMRAIMTGILIGAEEGNVLLRDVFEKFKSRWIKSLLNKREDITHRKMIKTLELWRFEDFEENVKNKKINFMVCEIS